MAFSYHVSRFTLTHVAPLGLWFLGMPPGYKHAAPLGLNPSPLLASLRKSGQDAPPTEDVAPLCRVWDMSPGYKHVAPLGLTTSPLFVSSLPRFHPSSPPRLLASSLPRPPCDVKNGLGNPIRNPPSASALSVQGYGTRRVPTTLHPLASPFSPPVS